MKYANQHVFIAKDDLTWLWPKRFGHYNVDSLKFMEKSRIVADIPMLADYKGVFTACQLA